MIIEELYRSQAPSPPPAKQLILKLYRFSKENFPDILKIVDRLKGIGEKHGASAGQVTLSWILSQGDDFVVIPGTKKIKASPI